VIFNKGDFEEVKKKPNKKTHMQRQRKNTKNKKNEEKETTITTQKNDKICSI